MKWPIAIIALLFCLNTQGQNLKIRARKLNALTGKQFVASISDTAIGLKQREKLIYKAIKRVIYQTFTVKWFY